MSRERKASLLFLISLLLFLGLSLIMGVVLNAVEAISDVNVDDLTYFLNAVMVSLPAFFIPALIFRKKTDMPRFAAPKFTHILMALGIGIGCLQLNQAISCFTSAALYNVEINSLSTTSESVMNLSGLNMVFSLAIIPPLSEEFMMRGTLLESWRKASPVGAMILTSLLFALLHSAPTSIHVYFMIGMLLALVYMITRNVWLTVIIHFVNNLGSVIAALLLKYYPDMNEIAGETAEMASNGALDRVYLVSVGFVYLTVSAAILVPLILGLRALYKHKKLGAYAPENGNISMESIAPESSWPSNSSPAEVSAVPEKKVKLLADPFIWISLVILIVINGISALIEFGVIDVSGLI